MYSSLDRLLASDHYVCSFSKYPNNLSQWRAYCGNGGYSIGFRTSKLNRLTENIAACLVACIYDRNHQNKLIKDVITTLLKQCDLAIVNTEDELEKFLNKQIHAYHVQVTFLGLIFKHTAFKEEAEWRLINMTSLRNTKGISHRKVKSSLIPYCIFQLQNEKVKDVIKTVTIAPMPDQHLAMQGLKSFLEKNNIKINIELSEIPYRG